METLIRYLKGPWTWGLASGLLILVAIQGYAWPAFAAGDSAHMPTMHMSMPMPAAGHPGTMPAMAKGKQAKPAKISQATEQWVCPMHPNVIQDHPGKCPICGMDLVKVKHSHPAMHMTMPKPAAGHPGTMPAMAKGKQAKPAKISQATAQWVCPMHPDVIQDHPGKCPICGMDLVKVKHAQPATQEVPSGASEVDIDAATVQRLGVRLAKAQTRILSREIRAYGNVDLDQAEQWVVSPKAQGWIMKIYVDHVGQRVRKGQVLYKLYSPALLTQQEEYADLDDRVDQYKQAKPRYRNQRNGVLENLVLDHTRMRERLHYADMSDHDIRQLEKDPDTTVPVFAVHAPHDGYVQQIKVREGSPVSPGETILAMARVGKVWVDIALYPRDADWVDEGDPVTIVGGRAGQGVIKGRLHLVGPLADDTTRALRARVVLDNPGNRLMPGTFVDAIVHAEAHRALAVPRSAVMHTGMGDRVMLALGDGRFIPTPVHTGVETEQWTEITSGLDAGATVAVNGNYLLDAAASLNDALWRAQARSASGH